MKICFLTLRTMWKNKWSYLLLVFELAICSVLFLIMSSNVQGIWSSRKVVNAFRGENMYYYAMYSYIDKSLEDIVSKDIFEKIQIAEIPSLWLTVNKDYGYSAYGYSDIVIRASDFDLADGIWFDAYHGEYIPAISADPALPTGSIIEVPEEKAVYKLEVIGSLSRNSYILNFSAGASSEDALGLDNFVSHPNKQLIIPYKGTQYQSVLEEFIDNESEFSYMIFVPDEHTAEQLKEQIRDYGSWSSLEMMEKNYKEDVRDQLLLNGIILIVFSILSIAGIIGFHGIQSALQEKQYIIYYLSGCTRRQCVVMEILKNAILLGVSFIIVMFLQTKMDIFEYDHKNFMLVDEKTIIIMFLFLFFICFMTSIGYIIKLSRKNLIAEYKIKA